MLNDKQSLILCGILAGGIFVTGLLNILDHFIVLTVITVLFLAIIFNLVLSNLDSNKDKPKDSK